MSQRTPRKCLKCSTQIGGQGKTGLCLQCWGEAKTIVPPPPADPLAHLAADRAARVAKREGVTTKAKYDEALRTIERLENTLAASAALEGRVVDTVTLVPQRGSKTSEATCVWVASDWHVEETVGPEVGDLNRYSVDIAKARATTFFQSGLRLTNLLAQDIKIDTIVLALLGDYITNDIHEEMPDSNAMTPMHALALAQALLISGIEFLLAHSAYTMVIPCHSGNHARTTRTTRSASENGHSLEYLMYRHLAAYFRHEPRVTFVIPYGMHSYLTVYDQTIRFQHGHAIKYGGGVGGIYIPVNKAIAQWNKAKRADLDVFGHFHQLRDGGNFICNGSLIGFNAFALAIKADYERPKQALFLLDKKRGRTCTWPILFDQ